MSINDWLSNLLRPVSPSDREQQLELAAKKLEQRADHAEKVASLQKRITTAKKRIAATGSAGIAGFLQGNRLLVAIVVVVALVLWIAKSCS